MTLPTKAEKARIRNWSKMRLLGLIFHPGIPLLPEEKSILNQIDELRNKLLYNWDSNTKILKDKNWNE